MALVSSSVKVPRLCLIADQTWKNPPSHQKNKHIVDESEMPFCFFFFLKKIWLEVKYIICFLSPFFFFSLPQKIQLKKLEIKGISFSNIQMTYLAIEYPGDMLSYYMKRMMWSRSKNRCVDKLDL